MPWSNQGGGPWGSGPKGPWGSGPQSSGPTPPDLEEFLRRSQDKLRSVLPGGGFGNTGFAIFAVLAFFAWLASVAWQLPLRSLGMPWRFRRR